jgi:hypothetical protein
MMHMKKRIRVRRGCKKKKYRLMKRLVKRISESVISVSVITFLLTTVLWHLYTQRPIVYSEIAVPQCYNADKEGSLWLEIRLCNTGGADVQLEILIKSETVLEPQLEWSFEAHSVTIQKVLILLIGKGKNFKSVNLSIPILHTSWAFHISVTAHMTLSLATMFAEYHALTSTSFSYQKQGDGNYYLDFAF